MSETGKSEATAGTPSPERLGSQIYLERNRDVAKIHGIVSGLDAIAAGAMKRKGMPLWLFGMLGAEKRRAKELIAPLVARRDEIANTGRAAR